MARAEFEAQLPSLLENVFTTFSDTLKEANDKDIEAQFGDDSKLTVRERVLGGKNITQHLRKLNCEFTAEKYVHTFTQDDQVIVTGTCVWGNAKTAFTAVLDVDLAGSRLTIANLIIFPAK